MYFTLPHKGAHLVYTQKLSKVYTHKLYIAFANYILFPILIPKEIGRQYKFYSFVCANLLSRNPNELFHQC